jgi:GT2 family glycosyltransferase
MCLSSLLYSVSRLNLKCEFVLVDDASDPAERIPEAFRQHRAAAKGHEVKIIRPRTHQHYTGVFSIGLHYASRDIVLFISNDMVVPPCFLEAVLMVSSLSRSFGIVRGTSNYTDSHPEHRVEPPMRPKDFREVDAFSRNVFGAVGCAWVEDNLLSGDAILLKRELIEKIGVLDLRFFGYFGDIDYGMRAQLAGYRLVCAKGAWLFHEGSGHVKQDMIRYGMSYETVRDQRMALVEKAYQQFRGKWHMEGPATWDSGRDAGSTDFLRLARANAGRVPLNC